MSLPVPRSGPNRANREKQRKLWTDTKWRKTRKSSAPKVPTKGPISIFIEGVKYPSLAAAMRATGLSAWMIDTHYRGLKLKKRKEEPEGSS